MTRETNTITVLGAGDMGHGVAELAALKGFDVRIRDVDDAALARAHEKVRASLTKLASKQVVTPDAADAAFARLVFTTDLATALKGTDFVIEAVPEDLALKQRVFKEVEELAPSHAILASNTSTIKISEIAERLTGRDRVVGMHFFNPVMLMDLVEIIPGEGTRADVVDETRRVAERMGKQVVACAKDSPGFITSRLVGVWVGAAVLLNESGEGTREGIDSALKFGAGFPMGAFELADYTGLDIGYHAGAYIASKLGDAYAPLPSLRERVEAGKLGKKTGEGFYKWAGSRVAAPLSPDQAKSVDPARVLAVVANEAAKIVTEGVATAADVDKAMRLGCAFPKGPLAWADDAGLDNVLAILEDLRARDGHALYTPSPALTRLVAEGRLGRATGAGFHAYQDSTGPGAAEGDPMRGGTSTYENIRVEVDASTHVATLTLDRTHRMNAISPGLVADMRRAFAALDAEESVRVVVITGAGDKAFCAGADLTETGDITPASSAEIARDLNKVLLGFEGSGKIVVAALNGYAFGGGLEIALACDFRVAAKRVKLGLTEVTLGLLPASGGTQRLPKLIGLARAKELILLGSRISADDAFAWGLVNRVFENDTFANDVGAFASRLAKGAPIAQRYAKRALAHASTTPNEQGAELEAAAFGILLSTEDAMEGVTALFSKREAEFKGR